MNLEGKNATPRRAGKWDGVPRSNRDETRKVWTGRRAWLLQVNSLGTLEVSCVSHTASMSLVDIRLDSVLESSFGRRPCGRVGR